MYRYIHSIINNVSWLDDYLTDINECASSNGGCQQHNCTYTDGSYYCTCFDDYILSEKTTDVLVSQSVNVYWGTVYSEENLTALLSNPLE